MAKLAILAGGGILPTMVANQALANGEEILMISFTGQPQPEIPAGVEHYQQALGAVGQTLKLLKKHGVIRVVLAGYLPKPSLFSLRPDAKGLAILAKVLRRHDDEILKAVCEVLKNEGFQLVAVQDICPEILAEAGVLTEKSPDSAHKTDIKLGQEILTSIGNMDIGQAVIVKDKTVLGIEAIEGTDALIARCANLRGSANSGGTLVKMPKPNQTHKADLPTVGLKTIENLAKNNYAGIAVKAGSTLMLEQEKLLKLANEKGLFVVGI